MCRRCNPIRSTLTLVLLAVLALGAAGIAGCGDSDRLVGGTWTAEDGRSLVFSADRTVQVQGMTASYEVDGDRILINGEPVYTSVTWVGEDEFRANETFSPGGAPRLVRFTRTP